MNACASKCHVRDFQTVRLNAFAQAAAVNDGVARKLHAMEQTDVCKAVQPRWGSVAYPAVMLCCAYCEQEATMRIVSIPEQVCFDHAMEFWTGLIDYARDTSDTCVKQERVCTCRACEELNASYLRASAIAFAGPPPQDREDFSIRLAS
jgi:hypothetical protein